MTRGPLANACSFVPDSEQLESGLRRVRIVPAGGGGGSQMGTWMAGVEAHAGRSPKAQLDLLMARLADGDRSVFARVFELLWEPIRRFCLSLLRNEADAADAAQEAMQKILERAAVDYDRERAAMPWAMAIAGWECRTIARRRFRRREVVEQAAGERPGADAEAELVQRDLTRAAVAALGELSDADHETLVATFWDEAASASGATLRKRRERALGRLRSAFRRLYGVE
jgi:RNA polymerase sigma-70 factor, ECF subfamily